MIKMAVQQIVLKFAAAASVSGGRTLFTNFSSIDSSLSSVRLVNVPVHRFVRSFAASSSEKIKVPRKRRRLDEVCLERFQQYSRTFIQSWIIQGKVFVDGKVVNKCGAQISDKSVVDIQAEVPKYVCRAGHKLEAAIELLEIDVTGKVALDSGLSTGGFTDCLLQYGASFVYGVDVGYGQVAEKIRVHECVSVIERTNLRYLKELPQKVDIVTLDLSFISILTVMPAVINLMKNDAMLVTLIKPQFEAHRSQVGGGGIVRDPLVHQEVLAKIINGVQGFGFQCQGWIDSPLKGADGNKEFLASFSRMEDADPPKADLAQLFRCVESQPAM
ncbi:hemolysin A isoform X1 [Salvia hispanica]|uniref:hemolysin A isoform X1 n=1 Tax=Salvia hispanica TaxID=49212 RepID=UPI0020096914|nr:hemolysin A isoform X1 [Salvia hispanica]